MGDIFDASCLPIIKLIENLGTLFGNIIIYPYWHIVYVIFKIQN